MKEFNKSSYGIEKLDESNKTNKEMSIQNHQADEFENAMKSAGGKN